MKIILCLILGITLAYFVGKLEVSIKKETTKQALEEYEKEKQAREKSRE